MTTTIHVIPILGETWEKFCTTYDVTWMWTFWKEEWGAGGEPPSALKHNVGKEESLASLSNYDWTLDNAQI